MGHRAGDNSQVQALGEALGWPFEIKRFVYTSWERIVNLPFATTLAGVVKSRSSRVEPPWPDLVISAGRRNEPIARWIQKRAGESVRMVHVGRPWAPIECFDLVITTPQYRLPDLPNVLQNETPLHRVTPERVAAAAAQWSERVAELPRPYVAILAGGNSGPYPFDRSSGERLARQASALAAEQGGSLLVTTSARTPASTTEGLFAGVTRPALRFRWTPECTENPYFAFLGLADALVVTADSISMMTEACATGRPVYLFDTGEGKASMRGRLDGRESAQGALGWRRWNRHTLRALAYRLMMEHGPQRWSRDIRIVQQRLVDTRRATWLGDGPPPESPPPLRDLDRAVERVQALFVTGPARRSAEFKPPTEACAPAPRRHPA